MMCESRFSMGIDSSRSNPLPCGTPSTMSTRTISASSFEAIQWAAVAPTFPEPTMETFFRMSSPELLFARRLFRHCAQGIHVLDHVIGKLAGFDFFCARHLALKIVGHSLLLDGLFHRVLDEPRRFIPAQQLEQHHAGEDHRAGI